MVDDTLKAAPSQTSTDGVTITGLAPRQSTIIQNAKKGTSTSRPTVMLHPPTKSCGQKKRTLADDACADFSDIDDAEVAGYLNNSKEMLFKKLIWEATNKDYAKEKQQPTKRKKVAPAKRTVKIASKMETENKKKPSSKINFDVLKEIIGETDETSPGKTKEGVVNTNFGDDNDVGLSKDGSNLESYSIEEGNCSDEYGNGNENENENDYVEEFEEDVDYYDNTYPENDYEADQYGYSE